MTADFPAKSIPYHIYTNKLPHVHDKFMPDIISLCLSSAKTDTYLLNKGDNKITELQTILQRESQNS
jgi:hypothetical protein